jgi:uncharacterized short protein YbdD (DUF466 family)
VRARLHALRERAARLGRAFKQAVGIPDFDRYREHMQRCHPGQPLLSERDFHARAIDSRFGAGRAGCC